MRKTLFMIFLASFALMMTSCDSKKSKDGKKAGQESEQMFVTEESLEYVELKKVQLPCEKDLLYNAWKQIGVIDLKRKNSLDYKQNTPTLFFSTDLDDDGNPEVLLRSNPPYAAIFSFVEDSLHLITFVDHAKMGLAITQDGVILRNSIGQDGANVSEFIQLENSQIAAMGATQETFAVKNGAMVSGGTQYMLFIDSTMTKVNKEEFEKVAPQQNGTFLEDIDGWEDFRKP